METEVKREKVVITLNDGKVLWAKITIMAPNTRIQDVANDYRKFIPLLVLKENPKRSSEDVETFLLVNKDDIYTIEPR